MHHPPLSQDFLNGVCTHIIWLTKQKLTYYTGNYDTFIKTVDEERIIQQKKYEKEQVRAEAGEGGIGANILATQGS